MKLFATLLLIGMMGCYNFQKKIILLEPGDSKSRVHQVMGDPDDTQFHGNRQVWQYWGTVSFGACEYRTFWFEDGRLLGATSYRSACMGGCTPCARPVDWSNPPDKVIEVRHR